MCIEKLTTAVSAQTSELHNRIIIQVYRISSSLSSSLPAVAHDALEQSTVRMQPICQARPHTITVSGVCVRERQTETDRELLFIPADSLSYRFSFDRRCSSSCSVSFSLYCSRDRSSKSLSNAHTIHDTNSQITHTFAPSQHRHQKIWHI